MNKRNVSCIPIGTYECAEYSSAKYKDVWEIKNVPNRSSILFHAGNSTHDTEGCVLVGTNFNGHMIGRSRDALDKLRVILPDEFTMHIAHA